MRLRDYQGQLSNDAARRLKVFHLCYLCMEVRTGKTITALHTATILGKENVLFITKKKAISSIESDAAGYKIGYRLTVVNYEQLHKIKNEYDFIIADEAHCLGAFPIPSIRADELKRIAKDRDILYLSGTPTPESFSQYFHQFFVSSFSPWKRFENFYRWAREYVIVKKKYLYNREINDYTEAVEEKVKKDILPFLLTFTQQQAGFEMLVNEHIIKLPMPEIIYKTVQKLRRDKVIITKAGLEILADTAVKEMAKVHQLCSGTIICEDGTTIIIDKSKALHIKQYFADKKIAIFYKFKAEGDVLRDVFKGRTIEDADAFNKAGQEVVYISQVQSGREGINLSTADALVMYNIDFSAVSYWQSRARLQTQARTKAADVYWLFMEGGIEERIYKVVQSKKNYTKNIYLKW